MAEPVLLPRYKCHKIVQAARITRIDRRGTPEVKVLILGEAGQELVINDEFANKHHPKVGKYLVVYEDGHKSITPAEVFEAGYALIEEEESE
jgi:hypothetical protein